MSSIASRALAGIWSLANGSASALDRVRPAGSEPALASSFRVGSAAQAAIAASALAAAEVWRLRSGEALPVTVDMRHAAAEFRSERYLRVNGESLAYWDPIAGTYRCGDGRWVRLHTNFPHHRDGALALLECEGTRDAVQAALSAWNAEAFETAAAERGLVVTMMRSFEEWDAHPQGRAIEGLPVVSIERLGDAPVAPLAPATRPLSGLRVLDLTRIIAGPVATRALAAHGADVMRITAPHLPSVEALAIDTGRGKRSAELDLRDTAQRAVFDTLLGKSDVFAQAYRPGALHRFGLSPEEAAKRRPGIVYASLSAYGHEGPWAARRGFDSLVQTASGFNHAEAEAARDKGPRVLPCQALDHASGYLLAFGVMMALLRRATSGGSWHVRTALATTGKWLRDLGRDENGLAGPDPGIDDVSDLLETSESPFGRITAVRHAGLLPEPLAPRWSLPTVPLGTHPPRWD